MRTPARRSNWTVLAFVLAGAVGACATRPTYVQNPLIDQLIYPHPEFPGLVNRACVSWKGDDCEKWKVAIHDTSDEQVRENLQRLKFVCSVGDRMFHPCLKRNGLCRVTYGKRPFLGMIGKKPKREEFLSLEDGPDKAFLLSAGTTCSRFGAYEDEPLW